MKIEMHDIPISALVDGYEDKGEEGVIGYGGKLDVRPPYQREFVYGEDQARAVIESVMKNFPLNVMYWVEDGKGGYEMLDGQQRTISIGQYVNGEFSVGVANDGRPRYYANLTGEERESMLKYPLTVYFCNGTDEEIKDWFRIVNIAGEKLTEQELRNAIYRGPWVSDARRYFSKQNGPASGLGGAYVKGAAIRQEILETAIEWICDGRGKKIDEYMAQHQNDPNASNLWQHFQTVIHWIQAIFPTYRDEMKGQPWGKLYRDYANRELNAKDLETEISMLLQDDEVTEPRGIWQYVLTRKEKHLNLRQFLPRDKRATYESQGGKCNICKKKIAMAEAHADHKEPWSEGGKTTLDNCQVLCRECNLSKGAR